MKKIFQITIWLIIFSGIIVLLSFAAVDHKQATCTAVKIHFTDQENKSFIHEADILKMIDQEFDSLTGCLLDSINTSAIAGILKANPYIREAAVFESVSGKIQVEVEREVPLVRIIGKDHDNFYLAQSGRVLPQSKNFTPHTMVATGKIDYTYKSVRDQIFDHTLADQHPLASIYCLANALAGHQYLNASIEQIYLNNNGELELVPADGDHIIVLGDASDLSTKFNNLMAFYSAGKPGVNEGYHLVNLKFTNQVVCKK